MTKDVITTLLSDANVKRMTINEETLQLRSLIGGMAQSKFKDDVSNCIGKNHIKSLFYSKCIDQLTEELNKVTEDDKLTLLNR